MFTPIVQTPNGRGLPKWAPPTVEQRVQSSGSMLVEALEFAYASIQAEYPELPDAVIVTGSGANAYGLKWGHFGHDMWHDAIINGRRPELFIGGECLARGGEWAMNVLLHETAHALNYAHDEKGTSQRHAYHNHVFLERAQDLGLDYSELFKAPDPTHGYSNVKLTEDGKARWAVQIKALEEAITLSIDSGMYAGVGVGEGGNGHGVTRRRNRGLGGRNYLKATCACNYVIRAAANTLAVTTITCGTCGEEFTP
jgi:hypothetical protein